MVALHAVDYAAAGLGELGRPEGYVQRQIEGWSGRYLNARTDDVPEMERTAAWLAENMPRGVRRGPDPQRLQVRQHRLGPGRLVGDRRRS